MSDDTRIVNFRADQEVWDRIERIKRRFGLTTTTEALRFSLREVELLHKLAPEEPGRVA